MIIYRKHEKEKTSMECVSKIRLLLSEIGRAAEVMHERTVEVFIDWGEFESGVADRLCPDTDSLSLTSRELRRISLMTGHMLLDSWEGRGPGVKSRAVEMSAALDGLLLHFNIPEKITVREPEGYAYYGLYPETYIEAANAFYNEARPDKAIVIGLRSIGTSLSAVVAAALESRGAEVEMFTLRPRGHPFCREASISPGFRDYLLSVRGGHFIIVDEGPGLSGSSFASAIRLLLRLGVPYARISVFPSWAPGGERFFDKGAGELWRRVKKYSIDFDALKEKLLLDAHEKGGLLDISAGGWRALFYRKGETLPPVHPNHEKRKYIFEGRSAKYLYKFAGHGHYGRRKHRRAELISEAGFGQKPIGLRNGFLISEFAEGSPLREGFQNEGFLDTAARYISFIREAFTSEERVSFNEISRMAVRNVHLGLGEEWVSPLSRLKMFEGLYWDLKICSVDGRMLPHEWLRTKKGFLKTDGIDHNSDQFFPRCQDTAWDIVGIITEFGLDGAASHYLLKRYETISGDIVSEKRLRFNKVAYLAYRLGYARFAADELKGLPDGEGFERLFGRYVLMLKEEIKGLSLKGK